ncbi:gamma carbonic anhydrase family protein [Agromyces kandeliae]|uniref:Gamma carbonic anhydrase family protein n=1 Tax=Agromyces kandeliae TaxID=2666141 RepID=A0A6L5R4G7_9MICO|nr:gamma carbonic anhydrase family protein [Agromyces kandeliae]MRX44882.1 gamma carbonic anhydrase family protein [Agromyces kandeliae]
MLVRHRDREPAIDASAYVAESAVVVGAVRIGAGARVLHGAVITAEDGDVAIGEDTVIMEHALIRGRADHPVRIGSAVMIGPHTHVNGSTVEDEAFIATGASLFPGSRIGSGAEVRVNGVVQVRTTVEPGAVVPIGWVAVGAPASILPPERHDEIWAIQRELDFPGTVYGVTRGTPMREIMRRQSDHFGAHSDDRVIDRRGDD